MQRYLKALRSGLSSRALITCTLLGALAQANAATAQPVTAQGAEAAPKQETTGDIVVTATRTSSLASKTPVALTAISGSGLTQAGITTPTALADRVPNLSIDRANGLQITIRGVSSSDYTEKGDPSAAFMLDGIYIARPAAQDVSFFDVDRVEVLRGPQGTLYGRNTTAGVVNVISAKPSHKLGGNATISYGNYNAVNATGGVNIPVTQTLALRGAFSYNRRDNFVTTPGGYKANPFFDDLALRGTALWEPTDTLTVTVRGDWARRAGYTSNFVPISNFYNMSNVRAAAGQFGTTPTYVDGLSNSARLSQGYASQYDNKRNEKIWGIMSDTQFQLSDKLTLSWLGSYREFHQANQQTGLPGFIPGTTTPAVQVNNPINAVFSQNSQELRLSYAAPGLKLQAGGYYFQENGNQVSNFIGLFAPNPGTLGYVYGFPAKTKATAVAFFGQGTKDIIDGLRLTAGVRWTQDTKSRVGANTFHANLNDPINYATTDSLLDARVVSRKVTWKIGVEKDLNARTLAYATVSTGYKAGGFNDGCAATSANCRSPLPTAALYYQPETLTSYELGIKTRSVDGKLRGAASYFHYDYNGLQLTQQSNLCGGPCAVTTNAASATVDGVETEASFSPDSRNRFDLGVNWLRGRYGNFLAAPGVNFAGRALDRSPDWTLNGGYSYTLPLANGGNVKASVYSRYSSSYQLLSTTLLAQFRQPGFTKTDLTLRYSAPNDGWYAEGFVKNVENNVTLSSVVVAVFYPTFSNGQLWFSDPRTYGLRVGAKF